MISPTAVVVVVVIVVGVVVVVVVVVVVAGADNESRNEWKTNCFFELSNLIGLLAQDLLGCLLETRHPVIVREVGQIHLHNNNNNNIIVVIINNIIIVIIITTTIVVVVKQ